MGDRVGGPGVFGERVVVQINAASASVNSHILQDSAKPACGIEDLRLGFGGEADDFGVASSLEVEDAPVAPAVFIITDEPAERVGREGGLSGPAQTKEEGHIVAFAHIGGAMH